MRTRHRLVSVIAVAALAAVGCSSSSGGSSTATSNGGSSSSGTGSSSAPLRILMITPLSSASIGVLAETAEQAAKAAIKAVNDAGGVLGHPVEMTVVDDGGDATTSVTKLQSAIHSSSKPVVVLSAGASTEAKAELPVASQAKIVTFNQAPTADSGDPSKYPYNFDLSPSPQNYAEAFCPYVKSQGGKSVAVINGNDPYGQPLGDAMVSECKKAGVTVTGHQSFELTSLDLTPQLSNLQSGKPDFLLAQAFGASAGYFFQGLQKLGWTIPVLGDDSLGVSGGTLAPPPTGYLGTPAEKNTKVEMFSSTVYSANAPAPVKEMIANMKAQGPIKAPLILAYMYDAIILSAAGAQAAHTTTDGAAIAKAIEQLPPGKAPTAIFPAYHFTAQSHAPNVDINAFTFTPVTKLVDGQFGAPGSS